MWRNCGEMKEKLLHRWWDVTCCSWFGKIWWFLKNLNTQLPHESATSFLDDHLRGWKHRVSQELVHEIFLGALFIVLKTWKQPKCPSADEWINEMWSIHTMEYYLSTKMKMYWIILQHRWYHYARWKKVTPRPYMVWWHLYETSRIDKSRDRN